MRNADILAGAVEGLHTQARQESYRTDPGGWAWDVLGVHLWSKQQQICRSVRDHKRTAVASCHGTGKALALDTPLPTPTGWTTMGEVEPGDELLDEHGRPTKVVAVTGVQKNRECYAVRFSDGARLVASGEHEWATLDSRARYSVRSECWRSGEPVVWRDHWSRAQVRTTEQIACDLYDDRSAKRQHNHAVPLNGPVGGTETGFVEDPYDMGASSGGRVPRTVMRAERSQRWAFLSGMLEVHGYIADSGQVVCVCDTGADARRTAELMRMEGWMVSGIRQRIERGSDSAVWQVSARCSANPFDEGTDLHTGFEDANAGKRTLSASSMRTVVGVEPVPSVAVKCVQVDSPSHLYLAGTEMVPTHNSMIASVLASWWVAVHPPGQAIVISTAPTYRQVNAILWEEIRKHHRTAKRRGNPLPGYVTQADEWKLDDGSLVGMGRKPADGDMHAFQGIHRPYVLVLLDEACGIAEELWTGVEAITTTANSRILAIGNPDDRDTTFGEVFCADKYAGMWNRIRIPASSTPNFTGERVPSPLPDLLVQREWVAERTMAWGTDDPRYKSKVEAVFPEQSTVSLFGPAVLAKAFDTENEADSFGPLRIGVDPARYGDDRTAVVAKRGRTAWVVDSWMGMDTVSTAMRVLNTVNDLRQRDDGGGAEADVQIRVDVVGLGAGVVDTLAAEQAKMEQRQGYAWFSVHEMNGAAAPPADMQASVQGYGNARAWWYDQAKQSMSNGSLNILHHGVLQDELAGVRFAYRSGRMYIESKEDMRKRGAKSPDFADALVYANAPLHEGLHEGDVLTSTAEDEAMALAAEHLAMGMQMQISPF